MKCYSRFNPASESCSACEFAAYCRDAKDPPLISHTPFEKIKNLECFSQSQTVEPLDDNCPFDDNTPTTSKQFSPAQWMTLVRRILEIDDARIRKIVRLKLENPDISLAEIGRHFLISKQAVDKEIAFACRQMPELSVILRNRPMFNKWRRKNAEPYQHTGKRRKNNFRQLELPLVQLKSNQNKISRLS